VDRIDRSGAAAGECRRARRRAAHRRVDRRARPPPRGDRPAIAGTVVVNGASERQPSVPMTLIVALVALGVVLSLRVVPSVFTVDENNYLVNVIALRQGHVTVATTAGLPPSRELLFFDPNAPQRAVNATPVASTMPPLYAWVALPFSWFGWR